MPGQAGYYTCCKNMKDKLIILAKKYPLYLFLLPIFFVLHGFTENYDFVPLADALLLSIIYLVAALLLLFIFRFVYKRWSKAALFTFFLLGFHFFFGSLHDGLKNLFNGGIITRYIFILPVSLFIFIALFIFLKKRKKRLSRFTGYLTILLILVILIDIGWLTGKLVGGRSKKDELPAGWADCRNCNKPDVYIIIADEYAGDKQLQNVFRFDNSPFYDQLTVRGFHVIPGSSSNYNLTPYSIASMLNINYLDEDKNSSQSLLSTYRSIQYSQLLKFFQHSGYSFYNYSYFNFDGQPSYTHETFLPLKTTLITGQTFLSRIEKEMRYHLAITLKSEEEIRKNVYYTRTNNEKLYRLTFNKASERNSRPKFVLTHLMIPHYPYYYDKNGNEFPFETLTEGNQHNEQHYIEYLQYGNKKYLELVDHILKNAASPPVILLIGDHGFRHFKRDADPNSIFSNLAAVYLPGNNYSSFSDSATNVNIIRTMFNTTFSQQLPYLKDTSFIINNP